MALSTAGFQGRRLSLQDAAGEAPGGGGAPGGQKPRDKMPAGMVARLALVVAWLLVAAAARAEAQASAVDRQRGVQMLDQLREDLVEHYHDPTFGGIDLDELIDTARQRINTAGSLGEIFSLLAAVCLNLGDSHTRFVPPDRIHDIRYGWTWRVVGDRALVDTVDRGSDARREGLRVGDTVIDVAGYPLTRANELTVRYLLTSLRPRAKLQVTIERNGVRRTLTTEARIRKRQGRFDLADPLDRAIVHTRQVMAAADRPKPKQTWLADGVLYWRLPDFYAPRSVTRAQAKTLARARQVVLDLRGNSGGRLVVLRQIAGMFAPLGTTVVTMRSRGAEEALATTAAAPPFTGRIVVLVDSRSGSSAEILARFLQQRGARIVGDVTRGAVTGARLFEHAAGENDIRVRYSVVVSVTDVAMADGTRLEGVGVRPDIISLPAPDDLERGADPVLAQAAALADVTLDPLKAGRFSR